MPADTMKKMAKVVDGQNVGDNNYTPMDGNFDNSIAFKAACDFGSLFEGKVQPSGYTEPILHKKRLEKSLKLKMKYLYFIFLMLTTKTFSSSLEPLKIYLKKYKLSRY